MLAKLFKNTTHKFMGPMAASKTVALLLYWMYNIWDMLPLTAVVALVTAARFPGLMATKKSNVINQGDAKHFLKSLCYFD